VFQAYLSKEESTVDRPVRWLAGFATVRAEPDSQHQVRLTLPARAFAHWDAGWHTEPGSYTLRIGTDAMHLPLAARISVGARPSYTQQSSRTRP
jgi:beta-glucosidase